MKTLISIYLKDLLRNNMLGLLVVLVPIIFYPLMYWGITQFIMIKKGVSESRKIVLNYKIESEEFSGIEDSLLSLSNIIPENTDLINPNKSGLFLTVSSQDHLPKYEVFIDSSNAIHKEIFSKLENKLIAYYNSETAKLIEKKNYSTEYFKVYNITARNIDGQNEIVTKVLSLIIPLISVMSILGSCVAASVELASGHTEDKTSETTLTIPLSREKIILSKFITVTIYGIIAGLVNFSFLIVFIMQIFRSFFGKIEEGLLDFDWSMVLNFKTILISIISLSLIAFFVSLIFITAAGFASKRKEGGVLVSPFMAIITYLPFVIIIPAVEPNILIAMTPVLNIAFSLKLIIANDINVLFIFETILFSLLWVLLLYKFLFPFLLEEEVLLGYSNTSLTKKIKMKMDRWKKK
ncbi:MAG: hypothetical protein KKD38_06050 [Candidatus Delongbacteria bacterium]|nr:hypothetical protein [Candidatus Delongbacteria bacterium]